CFKSDPLSVLVALSTLTLDEEVHVAGAGIGCVIAGLGFDSFGGHNTFFFLSVFAGCSMILSIILHLCIRGRKGSIDLTPSQNT
ncbi:unnamed protein product, partial [Larinioides sclopetarius]